jgi:AbrB family looped-hinge helix DNA binding protein
MPPRKGKDCCTKEDKGNNEKYHVEAIVSVDDRGQMVLPKEVRQRFGIEPGQKLAVIVMEREGRVCCLQLIKAESFSDQVKGLVGAGSAPAAR